MTIQTILSALVNLISNWKAPTNLQNDIEDGVLLLSSVPQLTQGSVIAGVAKKIVSQAQAGLANLEAGQAATVAQDGGYSLVLVKDGGPAAQSLGL